MNFCISMFVISLGFVIGEIGMKKIICLAALVFAFGITSPVLAAPGGHHGGGHGGHGHSIGHRPHGGGHSYRPHHISRPIHHHHYIGGGYYRPYRPYYRPYYYSSYYYPASYYSTYSYYPSYSYDVVPAVAPEAGTVVVRDSYAGINTAANVINTAANVAATIKYLSW